MRKPVAFLLALLTVFGALSAAAALSKPALFIPKLSDGWEAFTQEGNEVQFGHYEQDNNAANGQEPITWIVLEYEQDSQEALLISKACLDALAYDHAPLLPSWAQCEIRQWLNQTFLRDAFTGEEQARIAVSQVKTEDKIVGDEHTYVTTGDFVYLLSDEEFERYYFPDGDDSESPQAGGSMAEPTPYAVARGAYQIEEYTSCCWWLRSSGSDYDDYASMVQFDGYTFYNDSFCKEAVRPVIRVRAPLPKGK